MLLFISTKNFFRDWSEIQMSSEQKRYSKVGTDIEEVKRLNSQSGLSYNEVKLLLAQQYANQKK